MSFSPNRRAAECRDQCQHAACEVLCFLIWERMAERRAKTKEWMESVWKSRGVHDNLRRCQWRPPVWFGE